MVGIQYDVAEAFMRKDYRRRGNFTSHGDAIYSYNLKLAEWKDGQVTPEWTIDPDEARKYSVSTSRHVNALLHYLPYNK